MKKDSPPGRRGQKKEQREGIEEEKKREKREGDPAPASGGE